MSGMKTNADPKIDYAFKHVFGREEGKLALRNLLNALLQAVGGPAIVSLELLNPFKDNAALDDRAFIVDIKARDESGRLFYIEMQVVAHNDFLQRALYYWAGMYRDQLHQSDGYSTLRPTIAVCFVDTLLFRDLPDYHLIFELRERRQARLFTDQMALHILELPKFDKAVNELTTDLDRWLYFLRHGAEIDAQAVPEPLDVPEVRWALGDLFMISQTDPERELYEARLKVQRDAASHQRAAREAGLAEGRALGLAEGRAEGRRADIRSLQESLGRNVTPLEELQSLSWEELERVWATLQADLRRR
jgi:predicted transposase/invertase (TIGR01784 family)